MSAQLKAIRKYLQGRIRERVPELAGRVYTNRGDPVTEGKCPCVVIWNLVEESQQEDQGPLQHEIEAQIILHVFSAGPGLEDDDGADDRLDDICELVRQVVLHEDTLEGLSREIRYQGADWGANLQTQGEHVFSDCRLRYLVKYVECQPGSKEEDLRPLRGIDAHFTLEDGGDDVEDLQSTTDYPQA